MKHIFVLSLIAILSANITLAAPNYDPNFKGHTYDDSYNVALFNKLEDEYHKKYTVKIDDTHYLDTSPIGAYNKEVWGEYFAQMNPDLIPNP